MPTMQFFVALALSAAGFPGTILCARAIRSPPPSLCLNGPPRGSGSRCDRHLVRHSMRSPTASRKTSCSLDLPRICFVH